MIRTLLGLSPMLAIGLVVGLAAQTTSPVPAETLLDQVLFDVPDIIQDKNLSITVQFVEEKLAKVVRDRDLSQYIL